MSESDLHIRFECPQCERYERIIARLESQVATLTAERDTIRAALKRCADAADRARIFLKNLTMRTGVETRVGRDGYKEYERLRDALADPMVVAVRKEIK